VGGDIRQGLWSAFGCVSTVRMVFPNAMDPAMFECINTVLHFFSKCAFTNLLSHDFCLSVTERSMLQVRKKEEENTALMVDKLQEVRASAVCVEFWFLYEV
jgi:hypothetical protein